ncbi:ferritin-like domain-containing protein [Paeniglutamicibacter sp. NPDC012692]|uniref:ferritin-like domain-containing protein n=1 Tax=Paeniglutamicibacter sp. NPDC012692 TaxID=3364388 RepID=UPI00367C8982
MTEQPNMDAGAATGTKPLAFDRWLEHFRGNPAYHRLIEADIDWNGRSMLDEPTRQAFINSFQRFELGESGDGKRLLSKAALEGDPTYLAALELLVREEQKHSALFRRGLDHLEAPSLEAHWSDAAFTVLRRALGLRTELGLFLIVESVAMGYFTALAERAPDPVLRGIGLRIATDEQDHIRFQIDRLRQGFRNTPRAGRVLIGMAWTVIAGGAAAVLAVDHGPALRACGLSPARYWRQAMVGFRRAAHSVLANPGAEPLGPLGKGVH